MEGDNLVSEKIFRQDATGSVAPPRHCMDRLIRTHMPQLVSVITGQCSLFALLVLACPPAARGARLEASTPERLSLREVKRDRCCARGGCWHKHAVDELG